MKFVSLEVMEKLETFAGELGYRSLSSDPSAEKPIKHRCPRCGTPISVTLHCAHQPDVMRC